MALTLQKTLDSDWTIARQSLRQDLDAIETVFNRRWGATFGQTNVLGPGAGGTGFSSYAIGNLLYASSATALSKLAIGAAGKILRSTGTLPVWSSFTIASSFAQGDLIYASAANTLIALAKNTTASRYLSNTGASNSPAWAQVNLANGVTGTLPVANGGWGLATLTAHALYVGNGTTAPTAIAVGTNNTVLHGATGADPVFSAVVEADLSLSDNTTADVSITKHGFAPKAPNDATKYLDGTGAYSVPSSGAGAQPYAIGTTTIATGKYLIMSNHLILTGVQRMTVQGTGRLRLTT